ncbi:MAG: universal stress protein [Magnetospirillum sp. WYHS-4]
MIVPAEKPLFRKIVLAACGTESCEGALRESIRLAKWSGAGLIGVSVVLGGGDMDDLRVDGGAGGEAQSEAAVRGVCTKALAEGVSCKGMVRHDQDASAAIADVAGEENADLIVLGRRDRSVVERFLFGSVSGDLATRPETCVMVVPRTARFEGRQVLLATDGEEHSIMATVYAHYLAKLAGAKLTALVVGNEESQTLPAWRQEADAVLARIHGWSRREGIAGNGLIRFGHPHQAILDAASEIGADLVVMGSHGRAGLSRILQGSVSDKVVAGAACPVMIVRG